MHLGKKIVFISQGKVVIFWTLPDKCLRQYLDEKMRTPDVLADFKKEVRGKTIELGNLHSPVSCVLPPTLNLNHVIQICPKFAGVSDLSSPPLKHDPSTSFSHIILAKHEC